jgi:acyl carrier protein
VERAAIRVPQIIRETLDVPMDELVEPELTLRGDLGADSLDVVEVVMAVEEEWGFEVDTDDSEGFVTVADVVRYVERHVAGA